MHVNRCVCHKVTFRELRALSERLGVSDLNTLQQHTNCGRGCGLCVPYIEVAMRRRIDEVPYHAVQANTATSA